MVHTARKAMVQVCAPSYLVAVSVGSSQLERFRCSRRPQAGIGTHNSACDVHESGDICDKQQMTGKFSKHSNVFAPVSSPFSYVNAAQHAVQLW